jgi:hypothetical protein
MKCERNGDGLNFNLNHACYGPNKLESYIKLGFNGLPGTNTLAYWNYF